MKNLISIALLIFMLASCDPMSIKEYRMEPYSGALAWEQITSKAAWSNRYDHAAVAFKGKIWIFGGYDSGRLRGDTYLEDIWSSANGKDWVMVTDSAPWKGRRGHTVTVFDDGTGEALYLIGGFEVDEKTGYRQYTNDCWRSADGSAWTRIKERTQADRVITGDFMPRFNHACVAARQGGINYLYLIGGSTMLEGTEGGYSCIYFHDVWRSQNGISWVKLDNNDFGMRSELAACADPNSGRLYIHGGIFGVTFDNEDLFNQPGEFYYHVWYSDDGTSWQPDESFSTLRAGHTLMNYGQSLWLFPGKEDSYREIRYAEDSLYYTYRKAADQVWALDSKGSAFSGRHSYAAVDFMNALWILGGETADNGPNNDVWRGTLHN